MWWEEVGAGLYCRRVGVWVRELVLPWRVWVQVEVEFCSFFVLSH